MPRHSNPKAKLALKRINEIAEEYRKKHPKTSPQNARVEAGKIYRKKYKK